MHKVKTKKTKKNKKVDDGGRGESGDYIGSYV